MSEIYNREKIDRILERISFQIAENNYDKKKIIFVGIQESGYNFAKEVDEYLRKILTIKTELISLEIDKKMPETSEIKLSNALETEDTMIILVDDVINSGRTLFYALRPFMDKALNQIQTLVLVERKYKRFPITADYVGISLNTTMKEHIEVKVDKGLITSIELH